MRRRLVSHRDSVFLTEALPAGCPFVKFFVMEAAERGAPPVVALERHAAVLRVGGIDDRVPDFRRLALACGFELRAYNAAALMDEPLSVAAFIALLWAARLMLYYRSADRSFGAGERRSTPDQTETVTESRTDLKSAASRRGMCLSWWM